MERPTIAVLMSAYDEPEDWVRQSIDSVLAQTWENIHLYLVFDKPSGALEAYLEQRANDPHITLIKNSENLGLVGSLNTGLAQIAEDYVARLDADDAAAPTRLEREMAFMKEHDLRFVMSAAASMDDPETVLGLKGIPDLLTDDLANIERIANLSIHSSWLLERSVFEEMGGYRSVDHCEDYDFLLRCLQACIPVGRISDPLISYRFHESSISAGNYRVQRNIARILNDAYRNDREISALVPAELNEQGRNMNAFGDEALSAARDRLGEFSILFSQGKLSSAAILALGGCFTSRAFRSIFFEEVVRQLKLRRALHGLGK